MVTVAMQHDDSLMQFCEHLTCVGANMSQPLVHMRASMLSSSPKKRKGKLRSYGTCMPSALACHQAEMFAKEQEWQIAIMWYLDAIHTYTHSRVAQQSSKLAEFLLVMMVHQSVSQRLLLCCADTPSTVAVIEPCPTRLTSEALAQLWLSPATAA